jgi:hypothetical protein
MRLEIVPLPSHAPAQRSMRLDRLSFPRVSHFVLANKAGAIMRVTNGFVTMPELQHLDLLDSITLCVGVDEEQSACITNFYERLGSDYPRLESIDIDWSIDTLSRAGTDEVHWPDKRPKLQLVLNERVSPCHFFQFRQNFSQKTPPNSTL